MPARKKGFLPGVDPVFALQTKDSVGKPIKRFLTDQSNHPGEAPTTTNPTKIKSWTDRSGGYHFLKKHPKIREKFKVVSLTLTLGGQAADQVNARKRPTRSTHGRAVNALRRRTRTSSTSSPAAAAPAAG